MKSTRSLTSRCLFSATHCIIARPEDPLRFLGEFLLKDAAVREAQRVQEAQRALEAQQRAQAAAQQAEEASKAAAAAAAAAEALQAEQAKIVKEETPVAAPAAGLPETPSVSVDAVRQVLFQIDTALMHDLQPTSSEMQE